MAYGLQYKHESQNELGQDCVLLLYKKDTPEDIKTFLIEGDMQMDDDSDEGTIIARTLEFSIFADDDTVVEWDTFLSDNMDEWYVTLTVDSHFHFQGFVAPEEGNRPLLDKPYPIHLTCTVGLKLLKDVPLTDFFGNKFKGNFTLINYISSALSKCQSLPIRIYSSIFNQSHSNRAANIRNDMFQQTYLNARSFQTAADVFTNCYDALVFILGKVHRLNYWKGRWVIEYIGDHQVAPGGRYYTEYTTAGLATVGMLEPINYAQVGKAQMIYPINETPFQSSSFAIKSARTSFNYDIWPELPLNNKFERGTFVDQGNMPDIYDQDNDGNTTEIVGIYKRFTIDDWFYGLNTGPTSNTNLPVLQPTAAKAYRRSIYNRYGIELVRELQLGVTGDPFSSEKWLQSEAIPVRYGDKIKIDFNFRTDADTTATAINTARIYIVSPSGVKTSLTWDASLQFGQWIKETSSGSALRAIVSNYQVADNTGAYTSISVESQPIPTDGDLYIVLGSSTANGTYYYSGFNFEYIPYVAGGYIPVKGDYWLRGQNKVILDVEDEETAISDSSLAPVKGALRTATALTNPTWYRYGINESRHIKELFNIARFNLRARRYWHVEGEFSSIDIEPENDQLNKLPIGYHFNYLFPDFPVPRFFILTPPLSINVSTGVINAIFDEVVNPSDGVLEIDNVTDKIVAAINATSIATWQSNGLAPAVGTPGFPPSASRAFISGSNDIYLFVPATTVPTYSASANGAGNTPTLTQISQTVGTFKWIVLRAGSDIAVGNRFSITIFGVTVTVEVTENLMLNDGNRLGDYNEFNFIFDK